MLSSLGIEPVLKFLLEFPAHQFAKEHGAASRKGAGQPNNLGPEIFDGQVFLQLHAAQDGLELRDAGAGGGGGEALLPPGGRAPPYGEREGTRRAASAPPAEREEYTNPVLLVETAEGPPLGC